MSKLSLYKCTTEQLGVYYVISKTWGFASNQLTSMLDHSAYGVSNFRKVIECEALSTEDAPVVISSSSDSKNRSQLYKCETSRKHMYYVVGLSWDDATASLLSHFDKMKNIDTITSISLITEEIVQLNTSLINFNDASRLILPNSCKFNKSI